MRTSFVDLPYNALSAVFSQLHDEDYPTFIALRSACRKHRMVSETRFLRNIVLRGVRDSELVLLKRMRSVEERIGEHVHCIRLVPFDSRLKIAQNLVAQLEPCWSRLTNLKDIIWESPLPISPYLLDLVSSRSTLRLHYLNLSRDQHAMDRPLLAHPNLHTLEFTALTMGSPPHAWPSEMTQLKTCLMQARSIRVLHLSIDVSQNCSMVDFQDGELNLQFAQSNTFPALHKLVLDPRRHNYQLSPEHCSTWMNCMSWCQLHTLDFGDGSPTHLMSALTGRVPQLKELTFGFCYGPEAGLMWRCDDLTIVERFILSIDALQLVGMLSHKDDQMRKIRPSLLKKHGKSLRHVRAELGVRDEWQLEDFVQLADKAQNLQSLTATLGVVTFEGGRESIWPGDETSVPAPICFPAQNLPHHPPSATTQALKSISLRFGKLKSFLTSPTSHQTKTGKPPATISKLAIPSAATTLVCPRNIHATLTSMASLRDLKLHIILFHDTYDQIVDTRYPLKTTTSLLDRTKATNLMLKLWHDFGSDSMIERIQVAFHAPRPSGKIWTYAVARNWRRGKCEIDVSIEERGHEVEVFDPFA